MKIKNYYLIVMQRWGEASGHSYTIGIHEDPVGAKISGILHRYHRGGKYEPKIIKLELLEQPSFWLAEQYDGDRENLKIRVCHSQEIAKDVKNTSNREHVKIEQVIPAKTLSKEDIFEAHYYLSAFNNEEQAYLRDAYETLLRSPF